VQIKLNSELQISIDRKMARDKFQFYTNLILAKYEQAKQLTIQNIFRLR
jgi:hypothetical protein